MVYSSSRRVTKPTFRKKKETDCDTGPRIRLRPEQFCDLGILSLCVPPTKSLLSSPVAKSCTTHTYTSPAPLTTHIYSVCNRSLSTFRLQVICRHLGQFKVKCKRVKRVNIVGAVTIYPECFTSTNLARFQKRPHEVLSGPH